MGANDAIHRQRLAQLADELDKLEGFINMKAWVHVGAGTLEDAQAHPCGTAACIAGKAGLMPVFRAQGFEWNPESRDMPLDNAAFSIHGFSQSPAEFFGWDAFEAIFTGDWAMEFIHTPQQAAILIRHFLEAWEENGEDPEWADEWEPSSEVLAQIHALQPQAKIFPVSGFRSDYNVADNEWEDLTLTREETE